MRVRVDAGLGARVETAFRVIEFSTEDEAQKAIRDFNETQLQGRQIHVREVRWTQLPISAHRFRTARPRRDSVGVVRRRRGVRSAARSARTTGARGVRSAAAAVAATVSTSAACVRPSSGDADGAAQRHGRLAGPQRPLPSGRRHRSRRHQPQRRQPAQRDWLRHLRQQQRRGDRLQCVRESTRSR